MKTKFSELLLLCKTVGVEEGEVFGLAIVKLPATLDFGEDFRLIRIGAKVGALVGLSVGLTVGLTVGEAVGFGVCVGVDAGVGEGVGDGAGVGPVIAITDSCDQSGEPQLAVYRPTLNKYSPGPS